MTLYILVEHDQHTLHPSIRQVLSAAYSLDPHPILLVIGYQCAAVAATAALLPGVAEVRLLDDPAFQYPLAEQLCPIVAKLAATCSYLLMAATTHGKNILPRIAAIMDVAQVSDVTKVLDHQTIERPIYAGNAIETVQMGDAHKLMTIRATAFTAVAGQQNPCAVRTISAEISETPTRFIGQEFTPTTRPDLTNAKIIVAGGRGLQSAAQFALLATLADALGAALGASRAAVDAGFIGNDHQIGQTGKIVAPSLYFAIGISGAIQHIAGIKDARIIVAINKDEAAPIFQVANYGLVGDLFELVPELLRELKERGLSPC